MSYLLTEIALEMLGYKFYDIEGVLGATNFQSNGQINRNCVSGVNEEESLLSVLKLSQTHENPVPVKVMEHVSDFDRITTNCNAATSVSPNPACVTGLNSNNQDIDLNVQATSSLSREIKRRPLPNTLTRLLDQEYEKIRAQINRNKDVYLQSNADLITRVDERGYAVIPEYLTPFTQQERVNLQYELQTMHAFRKKIERTLFKFNAENFEKYKRTFVSQPDTLDKSMET